MTRAEQSVVGDKGTRRQGDTGIRIGIGSLSSLHLVPVSVQLQSRPLLPHPASFTAHWLLASSHGPAHSIER
jgi:hypothetical protein